MELTSKNNHESSFVDIDGQLLSKSLRFAYSTVGGENLLGFISRCKLNTPITTCTGVGNVLGIVILSEIGDLSRFSEPKKLVTFVGIDPSVKQSGEFTGTQNKMSKRGSPHLRRAIWMAAMERLSKLQCYPLFIKRNALRENITIQLLVLLQENSPYHLCCSTGQLTICAKLPTL